MQAQRDEAPVDITVSADCKRKIFCQCWCFNAQPSRAIVGVFHLRRYNNNALAK